MKLSTTLNVERGVRTEVKRRDPRLLSQWALSRAKFQPSTLPAAKETQWAPAAQLHSDGHRVPCRAGRDI